MNHTETPAPAPPAAASGRNGLLTFNVLWGIVGLVVGYAIGLWIGHRMGSRFDWVAAIDYNDIAILLGYALGTVGYLAGLGILNHPIARLFGRSGADLAKSSTGWSRYLRASTDHKVIGNQYLIGIGIFFFIGGVNAMLIRTELLQPNSPVFSPGQYLTIVGLHGAMMIMMVSSIILGPFGHFFVPLMIGSRRMAFPRLEALSFWLLPLAGVVLMTTIAYGGFPTGWTGYPTLGSQADSGMDGYLVAFGLVGIGMILNALNMLVTVFNHRAPGMTWSRLPIFVWSMLTTSVLMLLGPPMLLAAVGMEILDRTSGTTFFSSPTGGSPFLWENMFWFFGHPEVYILALPGFGIVLEILPVFARKPLWGQRLAIAGMLGVALLSFMVWQHHLFVSGINSSLRPFYMFTTELISVPTGFIFLVGIGTLWKAKIRYTVPMLFALAFFFNFLIGGLSGVYLSDVPSDVSLHGSFFVLAHFHYTIVGGLVFAFFAGIYYWLPKMAGVELNETLGKIHFWTTFVFFNSTFLPLFAVGMLGMPRRTATYAPHLQFLNDWVSISAFLLGGSMLVFLANFVWSLLVARIPAAANPWMARSIEWQLPTPVPVWDFDGPVRILAGPYEYGDPSAPPVMELGPPVVASAGD
jgi:cytochrome c oxidase subunit 1